MMKFEIDLPISPETSTHQSALKVIRTRDGRLFVGKYKRSKHRIWADALLLALKSARGHWECPEGALRVRLIFWFTHNKTATLKFSRHSRPKTTKPDLDNMAKSVLDCMTRARIITDDARISELILSKYWTPHESHITLAVEPLDYGN